MLTKLLSKVIDGAASATDPTRDQRLAYFASEIRKALSAQRDAFSLPAMSGHMQMTASERRQAAEMAYVSFLRKAWEDEAITAKEAQQLAWIAGKLELTPADRRRLDESLGHRVFLAALQQSLEDGELSEHDHARLSSIASMLGTTCEALAQRVYRDNAASLVRSQFQGSSAEIAKDLRHWTRVADTARRLGFDQQSLGRILEAQMRPFVERVLMDARIDGRLDATERAFIRELLDRLPIDPGLRRYFDDEALRLAKLTDVADGKMPSASMLEFALDPGERGFLQDAAAFVRVRMLKSGPRSERFVGTVGITDTRLLFRAPERSFAVRLRSIIGIDEIHGGVELSTGGKGDGRLLFASDAVLATTILRKAVSLAKQTSREDRAGERSRFIERDVRQRVWQKYCGACADCGSTDYLEFDHIVPVARGGSNSENNVQLLCRRCNLSKSDRI